MEGAEEEVEEELLHHLLCWEYRGQEEVGRLLNAVGWMVAGEEVGCRIVKVRALRMEVERNEKVLVAAVDHLCLLEEVGVARPHVLELPEEVEDLAAAGLVWEEGDQNGLVEVVGLGQRD